MRTTRDGIHTRWLPCPESAEVVDIGLSFADCRDGHGCEDRPPSHCPLYVERLVRCAVARDSTADAGIEPAGSIIS